MNILVITPYFYPEGGGLELYAYNISKRLVEKGHKVTVLCSTKDWKNHVENIHGMTVIRQKPHLIISNTPIKLDLFFVMSKIVKEKKLDLINAHTPVPYYAEVASWVSMIYKTPLVVTCHGILRGVTLILDLVARVNKHTFEKGLYRRAKRIITTSKFVKNSYLQHFSKKVIIIPPGVNSSQFDCSNRYPRGKNVLFVTASLSKSHEHKGLKYLLGAIPIVKETIKNVSLNVVGQGELSPKYKSLCEEIGISENVNFVGKLSEQNLLNEYCKTDVLVLPSTSDAEGFGMVLIEANACRKPVIGSRIGGIPSFIKNGVNGLLVPPRDPEALARAIKKVLCDKDFIMKMGSAGRAYVEKNFDWNDLTIKTENTFYEVIR